MSPCTLDPSKQLSALRTENRKLRNDLFELRTKVDGCGKLDTGDVNYVLPGISVSAGYALTFTWATLPGMNFLIESSTTQEIWTMLEGAYPAASSGEVTTYTAAALTPGGAPVYYRIRENPLNYNCCP